MFIETLNRVTQGITTHAPLKMIPSIDFKGKVYPKLSKMVPSTSDDSNFQKNLLLCTFQSETMPYRFKKLADLFKLLVVKHFESGFVEAPLSFERNILSASGVHAE